MVQETIQWSRRTVWKTEKDSLSVLVAAPKKRREAMHGIPVDRLDQRASIRADLLPERICLRLAGNLPDTRTNFDFCQCRRVRSVDFQLRDPVSGGRVFLAG